MSFTGYCKPEAHNFDCELSKNIPLIKTSLVEESSSTDCTEMYKNLLKYE